MLTYGSLFAGIGGFDLALQRAGYEGRWAVEIDPERRRLLTMRFPALQLRSDVRECGAHNLAPVDLVCGGFPCQDLSVAGRRAGLAGERSGLWWEFARILAELTPRWCLIENVPGLLSAVCPCPGDDTCGGIDDHEFGACPGIPHQVRGGTCTGGCMARHGGAMGLILGSLGQLGYGFAYRVLDAQFFGVAQRRRRVFIVGCLGDTARAVQVLLEPEGSARHSATRGAARPDVADCLETRSTDARQRPGGGI